MKTTQAPGSLQPKIPTNGQAQGVTGFDGAAAPPAACNRPDHSMRYPPANIFLQHDNQPQNIVLRLHDMICDEKTNNVQLFQDLIDLIKDNNGKISHLENNYEKTLPEYGNIKPILTLTLLVHAINKNKPEYVAILLIAGANPNMPSQDSKVGFKPYDTITPFHAAIRNGNAMIINHCIAAGANQHQASEYFCYQSNRIKTTTPAEAMKYPKSLTLNPRARL